MFKLVLGKARGTRDQIANIHWIVEKARVFQKNIYFCFTDKPKAFTVWIMTNSGKFFKRWEYQTTWPASWEICVQVRKQQLELDMEEQTGSKLGKEYVNAVYCHPVYLTYMQNTSWETLGWIKIAGRNINNLRWHHPYGRIKVEWKDKLCTENKR